MRTVRLLDRRPGETVNDCREVAGIVIESGIPLAMIPRQITAIVQALTALQVGDSLVWRHQAKDARIRVQGKHKGRSFASRKLPDGRYRIWRVK
jgi:hypothetical protein